MAKTETDERKLCVLTVAVVPVQLSKTPERPLCTTMFPLGEIRVKDAHGIMEGFISTGDWEDN